MSFCWIFRGRNLPAPSPDFRRPKKPGLSKKYQGYYTHVENRYNERKEYSCQNYSTWHSRARVQLRTQVQIYRCHWTSVRSVLGSSFLVTVAKRKKKNETNIPQYGPNKRVEDKVFIIMAFEKFCWRIWQCIHSQQTHAPKLSKYVHFSGHFVKSLAEIIHQTVSQTEFGKMTS